MVTDDSPACRRDHDEQPGSWSDSGLSSREKIRETDFGDSPAKIVFCFLSTPTKPLNGTCRNVGKWTRGISQIYYN